MTKIQIQGQTQQLSKTETSCRACAGNDLQPILDLGSTPLANSLLSQENLQNQENTYPLKLVFCPQCTLVQITETVLPEELFRHYLYFSSFADTTIKNAETLVNRIYKERKLNKTSLAAEIASNDGYLLQFYAREGVPVLGIEPATNIAKVANDRGIHTVSEFFGIDFARKQAEDGTFADIIHGNNVLAHVADLNGVAEGLAVMLKPDGMICIEAPYLKDMVDHVEFDTIYHEHLCYFSLTALDRLFRSHKLFICDFEHLDIHGGSLRIFLTKQDNPSQKVKEQLSTEKTLGMTEFKYYADFGKRVENLKTELLQVLKDLKNQGKRIAAYGASAKGSTLLNYYGIGQDWLSYVVDRSTVKQGKYTPGTHLPIYSPERLLEDKPDYVLLLTWNFVEEILEQQQSFRQGGGKFIVPIPELKIV